MNQQLIGEKKYFFSKYEDLVKFPDKSLDQIVSFLGINPKSFSKIPSFCGLPWGGNNFSGKIFKSVSDEQVGRWRERITKDEAALVEFHFKDFMERFGYKIEFSISKQLQAARDHYKWLNYESGNKADFSLATKVKF